MWGLISGGQLPLANFLERLSSTANRNSYNVSATLGLASMASLGICKMHTDRNSCRPQPPFHSSLAGLDPLPNAKRRNGLVKWGWGGGGGGGCAVQDPRIIGEIVVLIRTSNYHKKQIRIISLIAPLSQFASILENEAEKKLGVTLDEVLEFHRDNYLCRLRDMTFLKMSKFRQKIEEL